MEYNMLGVVRMFDLTSGNLTPVVNFEGISKNVMTVGFQVGDLKSESRYDRNLNQSMIDIYPH